MVDDYKPSLLKKFLEARGCVSALVSSWAPGQLYSPVVMSFRDKNDQTQCVFTHDGKEVAFQIDTKCLMSLFDVDKIHGNKIWISHGLCMAIAQAIEYGAFTPCLASLSPYAKSVSIDLNNFSWEKLEIEYDLKHIALD